MLHRAAFAQRHSRALAQRTFFGFGKADAPPPVSLEGKVCWYEIVYRGSEGERSIRRRYSNFDKLRNEIKQCDSELLTVVEKSQTNPHPFPRKETTLFSKLIMIEKRKQGLLAWFNALLPNESIAPLLRTFLAMDQMGSKRTGLVSRERLYMLREKLNDTDVEVKKNLRHMCAELHIDTTSADKSDSLHDFGSIDLEGSEIVEFKTGEGRYKYFGFQVTQKRGGAQDELRVCLLDEIKRNEWVRLMEANALKTGAPDDHDGTVSLTGQHVLLSEQVSRTTYMTSPRKSTLPSKLSAHQVDWFRSNRCVCMSSRTRNVVSILGCLLMRLTSCVLQQRSRGSNVGSNSDCH